MLKKILIITSFTLCISSAFAVRSITLTNNSSQPIQALCSYQGSHNAYHGNPLL